MNITRGYNKMSDCKINGTETSILNSITQILRTLPDISKVNCVSAGKSNGNIYAAKRINKFNLNMDDFLHAFSKLKSIEMMYGIELVVSIASVSEMQRKLNDAKLNNYINVTSEHPSDKDEVAFRFYNYLWVTSNPLTKDTTKREKTKKKRRSRKKSNLTKDKGGATTHKNDTITEPVSDSEDIMPRESFGSNSCKKCNYVYDDSNVYQCKDSVCNENEESKEHYVCEQCSDVCEECNRHVCFGGHMKFGMQTCAECYYKR